MNTLDADRRAPVSHRMGEPNCRVYRAALSDRLAVVFRIPIGATSLRDVLRVEWEPSPKFLTPDDVAAFQRARAAAIAAFIAEAGNVAGEVPHD